MKFSIVTPSFNQVEYVEATIKSVLSQTYNNYEYIIMDGGSTDGTIELISKYQDKLKKFISKNDDGQPDAINNGFKHADGEIYAYLNSDDCYFDYTLELVADIFNAHPEVEIVYGDCVFVGKDGEFIRYFTEIEEYDRLRLLNNTNFIMQPSTFWRRTVFDKYGPFNKDFHYGFDWAFWCELAKNGRNFYKLGKVLSANREYEDTKTSAGSKNRLKELKHINSIYKTTTLPYAYYGMKATEIENTKSKKSIFVILWIFYKLLSLPNQLAKYQNKSKLKINGILPNNYLQKKAKIVIPNYGGFSSAIIDLAIPKHKEQTVTIRSKGLRQGVYTFKGELLSVNIELNRSDSYVELQMEFEKEYRLPINKKIKVPCAEKVSAKLIKFSFE